MTIFHSLLHMIDMLHTKKDCRIYPENMRWNGKPICPHCGSISEHHYKLTKDGKFEGLYKCKYSAWFMLHRIRYNVKDDDANFNEMTQVDKTYVGGKTLEPS